MDHQVPYSNLDLENVDSNSTLFYPLQILQSPIRIKLTVYAGDSSGMLKPRINNERFHVRISFV
jgi:hypothetical protein